MNDLTEWMPVSTPPVRIGVYNVSCRHQYQSGLFYCYWDGKSFGVCRNRPSDVEVMKIRGGSGPDMKTWRGLSKRAK